MAHPARPTAEDNAMTSSYHEINDSDSVVVGKPSDSPASLEQLDQTARKLFDKARHWVGDLSLEGIVTQEGQQVTYVAQDLTEKIKLASPTKTQESELPRNDSDSRRADSISLAGSMSMSNDLNVIMNEIEFEAKKLASSVDNLTENLTGILHSVIITYINKYLTCLFKSKLTFGIVRYV